MAVFLRSWLTVKTKPRLIKSRLKNLHSEIKIFYRTCSCEKMQARVNTSQSVHTVTFIIKKLHNIEVQTCEILLFFITHRSTRLCHSHFHIIETLTFWNSLFFIIFFYFLKFSTPAFSSSSFLPTYPSLLFSSINIFLPQRLFLNKFPFCSTCAECFKSSAFEYTYTYMLNWQLEGTKKSRIQMK